MTDRVRRVLFAGGGTAGHVFPAIAVARELVAMEPDVEPVFVGTPDRLEDRLVPASGFRLHHVDALPLPRRLSPALFKVPGGVQRAVARCTEIAQHEEVVGAVTFGGFVSFPVSRAVAKLGLPLVLHEQNAVPGVANRLASRWATRVAVSFPDAVRRFGRGAEVVVTGNPVRDTMLGVDVEGRRAAARERFGLDPDLPTLLVFGGSQGARSLNGAVLDAADRWSDPSALQILHGAGARLHEEALAGWREKGANAPAVVCLDFIDHMVDAYAAADVVVCRAGATSIAELTVLGRPSVLVPYPYATRDHQTYNAESVATAGGAVVIADDDLDGPALVAAAEPWLLDAAARDRVAQQAELFGRPDAARAVATLVQDHVLSADRPRPHPGTFLPSLHLEVEEEFDPFADMADDEDPDQLPAPDPEPEEVNP